MGLLDKLTLSQGSVYSYENGQTPPTNVGATQQSKLHANGNLPGYSVNGSEFFSVNNAYQAYNDGVTNFLPQPSLLDINGGTPVGPLSDPSTPSINNSFNNGQYLNNLPG
jgi:hypothetical protein